MGARSYRIGSDDERYVRAIAEGLGYLVVRAAGSHGTDLIVFTPDGTYAVDVKRNTWAGPESRDMLTGWLDNNVWPWLCMVTVEGVGRRLQWRQVHGDGSMGEPDDAPPWGW